MIVDIDREQDRLIPDEMRQVKRRRSRWRMVVLTILAAVVLAGIGAAIYWHSLKSTPQYSLALLIDASDRDDAATVNKLVDVDAVVDDFTPQILDKAVDLYGRGLPPQVISRLKGVAGPVLPAIKDRARASLPKLIRDRVERFGNVPFPAMVVGAGYYLDIKTEGDKATASGKTEDRPLEIIMKRSGDHWTIVGVKDDALATEIARRVGQELIGLVQGGPQMRNTLGPADVVDLLKKAQEILQ